MAHRGVERPVAARVDGRESLRVDGRKSLRVVGRVAGGSAGGSTTGAASGGGGAAAGACGSSGAIFGASGGRLPGHSVTWHLGFIPFLRPSQPPHAVHTAVGSCENDWLRRSRCAAVMPTGSGVSGLQLEGADIAVGCEASVMSRFCNSRRLRSCHLR